MANPSDPRFGAMGYATRSRADADVYDAGLRSYMLSVYNYMLSGVLLTGVVALLFANTSWISSMFAPGGGLSGIGWIIALAPLGIVLTMSFGRARLSTSTLQLLFWVYAGLMGLSLSTIFLVYTAGSIAQVFFATAAGFAGLSLYGYTTKRDLSPIGAFLVMGLIGLIVAMLLNMLLFRSGEFDLILSVIGVLIFAGLTAWDTQKIKSMYQYVGGTEMQGKAAIMGALTLYLDFINMFLFLLRLFGSQRN